MGFKMGSFRFLLVAAFIQGMTVTCENVTEPTSNPDMITSTQPQPVTSSSVVQPTEKEKTSKTSVATTTSITTPTAEIKVVHATSDAAAEHPTHHEDKHATHAHPHETHEQTNHTGQGEHVTRPTMGYPHEPDVDAASNLKEEKHRDADWEVSVFVVIGLLCGMIVFVVFMVVKDKARRRTIRLSKEKRPVIVDDGFVPLKEVKTEEEPPKPLRAVEKSKTPRNSYYGNPEDSIPLLELYIKDGEPPLLHDEAKDTKPEETEQSGRKVVDVYGDTSEKPEEKFY